MQTAELVPRQTTRAATRRPHARAAKHAERLAHFKLALPGIIFTDLEGPAHNDSGSLLRPPTGTTLSPYLNLSPASSSLLHATTARPRAHTFTEADVMQQQGNAQEQYRRGTPGTPGGGAGGGIAQQASAGGSYGGMAGTRHMSEQHRAGGGYIPPPPPPPTQASAPPSMQYPPPPPPRHPSSATQTYGMGNMIPGPPSSQPSGYGQWNRQPNYTPRPPVNREPRMYDPMAYQEYMNLPPLPPEGSLVSATYIPGNDSFGPGVGIPPLHPQNTSPQPQHSRPEFIKQNSYNRGGSNDFSANYNNQAQHSQHPPQHQQSGWAQQHQYQQPIYHPQTQSQQAQQGSLYPPTPTTNVKKVIEPARETEQHQSPADPASRSAFGHGAVGAQTSETNSNRDHSSSGETPSSPYDHNWPLQRVLIWLAAHKFSKEWQSAFEHLDVHGSLFLDIGGRGRNKHRGFLLQTALPQVERECLAHDVTWNPEKEREETRRMRALIRDLVNKGGSGQTSATTGTSSNASLPSRNDRGSSSQFLGPGSAGTDGGVETSPNVSRNDNSAFGSTPVTANGTGDESPGSRMPPPNTLSLSHRRYSRELLGTTDSSMASINENGRSAFSTDVLRGLSERGGRNSPGAGSDLGQSRQSGAQSSPHQSPALQGARVACANANGRYYGHIRNASSPTHTAFHSSGTSPAPGRLSAGIASNNGAEDEITIPKSAPQDVNGRKAQDVPRPVALDASVRHPSQETPASAKDHKSGFLSKWRNKRRDDSHPSPDEEHSPSSPQVSRNLPYGRDNFASSNASLHDRTANKKSAHTGFENAESVLPAPLLPERGHPVAQNADKKFVFVTPDGWNYRLIDITEVETANQLRTVICYNLGVTESHDITMHVTNPGQTEHDDVLNDLSLLSARSRVADPTGSLKLFVRTPSLYSEPPESAGLGLTAGFPQSPFGRANFPATERPSAGQDAGSTLRSDESTLVPERFLPLQPTREGDFTKSSDYNAQLQQSMLQQDFQSLPECERLKLLKAKEDEHRKTAEEHRRRMEEKQQAYLAHRRALQGAGESVPGTLGTRFHDFDNPRTSPYPGQARTNTWRSTSTEQREQEAALVPMRKPPAVPEPTSTLVKVNSLTKKPGPGRSSWPNRKDEPWKRISSGSIPEEEGKAASKAVNRGISAALIGAGNIGGSVGAPTNAPGTSSGLSNISTTPGLQHPTARPEPRAITGVNFKQSGRNSPGSPRGTMSNGGQSFNIPELENGEITAEKPGTHPPPARNPPKRPNPSLRMPGNPALNKVKGPAWRNSPDISPSTASHPESDLSRTSSRRSPGPYFNVSGNKEVDFRPSETLQDEEDDDDSDDGLFAVPLAKQKPQPTSNKPPPTSANINSVLDLDAETASCSDSRRVQRPELTVRTSSAQQNVRWVSPQLPPIDQLDANTGKSTMGSTAGNSHDTERQLPPSAASTNWSADSPSESNRFERRESFASNLWATRPPAEQLVEHLDDFFPNVDLDQAMPEDESEAEGSAGEKSGSTLSTKASSASLNSRSITPLTSEDETNDTLGSNESTLKKGDISVAHRNMRKSGGLGRTKSIRDVVKGAYQMPGSQHHQTSSSSFASSRASGDIAPPQNPLNRISTLKQEGGIMRRKSTKMFGARIEQIKPSRGSRLLNNLDPIPQDQLPPSSVQHVNAVRAPERQPTFKWMRGQLIGKGTFGRVYLGMNTTTGELLAVKQVEVNPKLSNTDPSKIREMVKALDQEIDTMQHLDHVNIVQYLGCEKKEFSISIFLEYISGGSVGSCLRKHGKFEESVVSSLTRQTLCGLAYLHREGILHRDLKADNILLDVDGTCKISDFGISKRSTNPYNNDTSNSMQGSVFWMAPEVIRAQSQALTGGSSSGGDVGNQGYSAKVDIWSLGCVVLEMFAGRRPWSKEEAIGAIYKLGSLNQAPPIPDDVSDVVGPAAISFMLDCFTM